MMLVSGVMNRYVRNSIVMVIVVMLVWLLVCMFDVFLMYVVVDDVLSIEFVMIVVLLVSSVLFRWFILFLMSRFV